ncbi:hypothetical protein [Streptomyces antibioticus]|uniref:hypothetical protein n=1 Tax=Streptomyces antibioticus TaxID=1890 RepID=UPI0036FFD515
MEDLHIFVAAIGIGVTAMYGVLSGLLGNEPGAPAALQWPVQVWDVIAHGWRRPAPACPRPDYAKIARLERELGIGAVEPQPPNRPLGRVCLTKDCAGDTGEIYAWPGELVARIHTCVRP